MKITKEKIANELSKIDGSSTELNEEISNLIVDDANKILAKTMEASEEYGSVEDIPWEQDIVESIQKALISKIKG